LFHLFLTLFNLIYGNQNNFLQFLEVMLHHGLTHRAKNHFTV